MSIMTKKVLGTTKQVLLTLSLGQVPFKKSFVFHKKQFLTQIHLEVSKYKM